MTFEEFQHHARLYVLGTLDEEEMVAFEEGRRAHGEAAEEYLRECRKLGAALALSLAPQNPRSDSRERLLASIQSGRRRHEQRASARNH